MSVRFGRPVSTVVFCCLVFLQPAQAFAHVKWFSQIDWSTAPKSITEIVSPIFWGMFALTIVTLVVAVLADNWASQARPLVALGDWLEARSQHSLTVIRFAVFATLLVAWQQGTLLTPELDVANLWVERLQFLIIVLLMFPRTTSLAGLLFLGLWAYGAMRFGLFHMLDYLNAVGIGYFLVVRPLKNDRIRNTGLPALYVTVGFSLIWLACEKLVYPQWALYILEQNPILTLGLPASFFLVAAAFIEMGRVHANHLPVRTLSFDHNNARVLPDHVRVWEGRNHRAHACSCNIDCLSSGRSGAQVYTAVNVPQVDWNEDCICNS